MIMVSSQIRWSGKATLQGSCETQFGNLDFEAPGETAPGPGLCPWFGCCSLSKASKTTTNAMATHASVGPGYSKTEATLTEPWLH